MNDQSDYLEISEYECTIGELLRHNIQKYKYVGEKGKEYEVIQSVFYEINQLHELSNRQIRWYAIIINLVRHFSYQRSNDVEVDVFPPFIGLIELYIMEVVRWGALVSTKKEITATYFNYKMDKINSLLLELLRDMESCAAQERSGPWEEVFILTIKNAADNVIKLGQYLFKDKNSKNVFTGTVCSERYKRLINKRIERIDKKRLAGFYNMEAFWNGFIP